MTPSPTHSPLSNSFDDSTRRRSVRRTSSSNDLKKPIASKAWSSTPTLVELMQAELEKEESPFGLGLGLEVESGRESPAESMNLFPPLYGRPGRSPSPDIFAGLLSPLLSLSPLSSRPPSRVSTPVVTRSSSPILSTLQPSVINEFPPRSINNPQPTVESQGFVLFLLSALIYFVYLIWSFTPESILSKIGIEWYPAREWAVLVPAWTVMLGFFTYYFYIAINLFITPSLSSLHTLTDPQAYILPPTRVNGIHPLMINSVQAVPPLNDIPITLVNRVIFGDFRRIVTAVADKK